MVVLLHHLHCYFLAFRVWVTVVVVVVVVQPVVHRLRPVVVDRVDRVLGAEDHHQSTSLVLIPNSLCIRNHLSTAR